MEFPELNAELGTRRFLSILKDFNIKATFFVTGEILERYLGLIEEIISSGHEVASHGHHHPGPEGPYLVDLGEDKLKKEIRNSFDMFKDRGIDVKGFRAPACKVNTNVLREVANYFLYDSSVSKSPFSFGNYNNNTNVPAEIAGGLVELPISNIKYLGLPLGSPFFWMMVNAKCLILLMKTFGTTNPTIFYFHSYDLTGITKHDLKLRKWKQKLYYDKCGPSKIDFLIDLFTYLKSNNTIFMRCADFIKEFSYSNRIQ